MIYEMRTYTFNVGGAAEFERGFGEKIAEHNKFSKVGAFWRTEFGPLNQAIHVWPYEDLNQRMEIRKAARDAGAWPPKHTATILNQEAEILLPAPFMDPWGEDQELGNLYEMRIYTYKSGTMSQVLDRWAEAIPCRVKYSPLAACWYTELGSLNKFFHVWPYASMAEREKIRGQAAKEPTWPPRTSEFLLRQEIKIVLPAPFSPMR